MVRRQIKAHILTPKSETRIMTPISNGLVCLLKRGQRSFTAINREDTYQVYQLFFPFNSDAIRSLLFSSFLTRRISLCLSPLLLSPPPPRVYLEARKFVWTFLRFVCKFDLFLDFGCQWWFVRVYIRCGINLLLLPGLLIKSRVILQPRIYKNDLSNESTSTTVWES